MCVCVCDWVGRTVNVWWRSMGQAVRWEWRVNGWIVCTCSAHVETCIMFPCPAPCPTPHPLPHPQVQPLASSLHSSHTFIAYTVEELYVWSGQFSPPHERRGALVVVRMLDPDFL